MRCKTKDETRVDAARDESEQEERYEHFAPLRPCRPRRMKYAYFESYDDDNVDRLLSTLPFNLHLNRRYPAVVASSRRSASIEQQGVE